MAVSFLLSPEQEQLKAAARGFAEEHLRDLAAAVRAEPDPLTRAMLARPVIEKAVGQGFLKGLIPAPFGGAASSGVDAAIFIEEWAVHSPDLTISMAGPLIALAPVYEAGTPEQIRRFVAPFLADSGAPLAAMAFSEPEGSANFDAPDRHAHDRDARRRRLRDQRPQGLGVPPLGLGRRRPRPHDHRLPGPGRRLADRRRARAPGRARRGRGALRPAGPARVPDVPGPPARRAGAAREPPRRRGTGRRPDPQRLPAQRRVHRHLRRRRHARGLRHRPALRDHRDPRRRRPDHRPPGGVRRPRRRQGEDRGRPPPDLARARRRHVPAPRGARAGPARQGLRLRDRRRGAQRPGQAGRRHGVRRDEPDRRVPPRGARLPGDRGQQHRCATSSAPGPPAHARATTRSPRPG